MAEGPTDQEKGGARRFLGTAARTRQARGGVAGPGREYLAALAVAVHGPGDRAALRNDEL